MYREVAATHSMRAGQNSLLRVNLSDRLQIPVDDPDHLQKQIRIADDRNASVSSVLFAVLVLGNREHDLKERVREEASANHILGGVLGSRSDDYSQVLARIREGQIIELRDTVSDLRRFATSLSSAKPERPQRSLGRGAIAGITRASIGGHTRNAGSGYRTRIAGLDGAPGLGRRIQRRRRTRRAAIRRQQSAAHDEGPRKMHSRQPGREKMRLPVPRLLVCYCWQRARLARRHRPRSISLPILLTILSEVPLACCCLRASDATSAATRD